MSKGANVGLRELGAELGSVTVVLETAGTDDSAADADVSVLLLGPDGRVRTNDDMVFYNQRTALSGAIRLRDKVRVETEAGELLLDTVTLSLEDVPDDVERIVLLASLDPSLDMTFGTVARVRMRVQRAADAQDLISYSVTDAAEETALLFGEFYRRNGQWRIRAIGQGYRDGLSQLATDFGVDVDPLTDELGNTPKIQNSEAFPSQTDTNPGPPKSPTAKLDALHAPAVSERTSGDELEDPPKPERLSVRRPARAPKMPAAWDQTIPADDGDDWTPARLFPIAGIGGAEEQEQRATSVLLAVAAMVKEFGRAFVKAMDGPSGIIETFSEVRFGQDENAVRPDGVLLSSWGKRTWTALIEVKTAAKLDSRQIERYVDVARARGYDAVVMITNELTIASDDYPVSINRAKLHKVMLRHLGWDEIREIAVRCLDHKGVADPTQRRILAEFLRYLRHPRAGTHGFTDMGPHWVKVRDSAKGKTLRPADRGADEVVNRFDQMVRHVGLGLACLLGVEVQTTQPNGEDTSSRCQQFADSGVLFASIRVPGAVDSMVVGLDVRTERASCSVTLPAPRDARPTTRVNWLLRQIESAHDSVRVEALLSGTRGRSTAETLKAVRASPEVLLPKDNREIKSFRVTLDLPAGMKRDNGRGSVIGSVESLVFRFYGEVVQHLQREAPRRPPRLPTPAG